MERGGVWRRGVVPCAARFFGIRRPPVSAPSLSAAGGTLQDATTAAACAAAAGGAVVPARAGGNRGYGRAPRSDRPGVQCAPVRRPHPHVVERQVTAAPHGHVLTHAAVWSPDSRRVVYDVRPDPAGAVFDGAR